MAKNSEKSFIFGDNYEYCLYRSLFFSSDNKFPSFQGSEASKENKFFDPETEIRILKLKIKNLEENRIKDHEEIINREIQTMKQFQEKEKKMRTDYENLERKYNKILWKFDAVQKENLNLVKLINENKIETEDYQATSRDDKKQENFKENLGAVARCEYLQTQLDNVKNKKKTKLYKNKLISFEAALNQIIYEKNQKILELEETIKEFKRKNYSRSPISTTRSQRRDSVNQIQEIARMIASLEKSQAKYKQKYLRLQKLNLSPFSDITNVQDLLNKNEKKLKEAKKLQEKFLN